MSARPGASRDLPLSDTRQTGAEAALQVFEVQSLAHFLEPFLPESGEAFAGIAAFFDSRLAR